MKKTRQMGRTVVALATYTSTTTTSAIDWPLTEYVGGKFLLEIGTVAGTSPTLDVCIQTTPDDGTTWRVCWRFAQATDGTDRELTTTWGLGYDQLTTLNAERAALANTGGALSLGTPIADKIRVVFTIGGTSPSFPATLFFIPWRNDSENL